MTLNWTWDQAAEQIDFPRLQSFNRYWNKFPPIHKMIASYFGIGKNTTDGKGAAYATNKDILKDIGLDD